MGAVYRARDTKLGREVALKVLPPVVASSAVRRARFEREAKAVAALNHPNIVTLHSIEEDDGIPFITMELVEGETLADHTRGGITSQRFVDLAIPIVAAITAAHERGITHRDLKPQNILVTRDGRPKVLDFGLAKLTESDAAPRGDEATAMRTADGSIVGTAAYMSPEQALGDEVDHRSDIFSCGAVFYEMLTGRRPFQGETATRIIGNLIHTEPPPIAASDPVSAELARIVAKCLQKDRERRYQSARELRVDLDNLRGGSNISTWTTPTRAPAGSGTARNVAIASSVAVAVLLGLYLAFDRGPDTTPAAPRLTPEKTIAVLPFRNLSADENDAFFAQGVHEDLMTKLASLDDIKVISRTSVMRYATHDEELRKIGRRLGARYIVEGSVRRDGNAVRITANLVDTRTDRALWSSSYDRELRNVFAMQSAIAQEIATTLETRISPDEKKRLDSVPTVVIAAYDDYLKARSILNASRFGLEELKRAIGHLHAATTADPKFAAGWALLARAESDHYAILQELDDREADVLAAANDARIALDRTRALDPGGAATLRSEGYYHDVVGKNPIQALRSFDRSLAIEPDDPETLRFQGVLHFRLGQLEEMVSIMERAHRLDPHNGAVIYGLTFAYEATRQYAKMVPFFERLVALEPDKTHYAVQAKYYQFLADGKVTSFAELDDAIRTIRKTDACDVRTVQNLEMVVALVNDDFERYATNWQGKWERHQRSHGQWSCPAQLNEEANHAHLLMDRGQTVLARTIIERAKTEAPLPYTEMSMCLFDRDAFEPKLAFMSGEEELARREFDEAVVKIMRNEAFPRGAVERAVLLETADMVAPDRVYSIYREMLDSPVSLMSMEVICANPWTYPNLVKDPRFVAEVRKDGRFAKFLEAYGWM